MSGCVACGRDFHDECAQAPEGHPCCCSVQALPSVEESEPKVGQKRGPKTKLEGLSISGGRKRAAALWPLDREAACEWQRKANCGGGKFPIVGCVDGKQQNRHHGPVKNTAYNNRENIHLICAKCHNTWHAKNDAHYDESAYALLPHQPREATPIEMVTGNTYV